jgi:lipid-A-disaccharide synthase
MLGAYALLRQRFPGLRAAVSACGTLPSSLYKRLTGGAAEIFEGRLRDLLARSDFALVTSGTATLETALLGVPHVIVYHTSAVTHAIARRLIQIPFIGLPNIIAGRAVVPECIQERSSPEHLAAAAARFIESPEHYHATSEALIALRETLGRKKPSSEVALEAACILFLTQWKRRSHISSARKKGAVPSPW